LFSTTAALFFIPTSNAQGFQFSHILTNTCYFLINDSNHPTGYEVVSQHGLICIALTISKVEYLLHLFIDHLYILWRKVHSSPLLILIGLLSLMLIWSSLCIVDTSSLSNIWLAKIFFHSVVSFLLCWVYSLMYMSFSFWCSTFYFSFCCLCFWHYIQESLPNPMLWGLSPTRGFFHF
jgi:hypothetical protein